MRIQSLSPDLRSRWDAFVQAHADGTFFHLSGWERVLREAFGHRTRYLIARDGEAVAGVLPLVELKSALFGHSLISMPFGVYGGAIARDAATRAALEDAAVALGRERGVDYVEFRNRVQQRPEWPQKTLYCTFRREIDPDPEKILLSIPRKQRAEVRAGLSNALAIELDPDCARFYRIYSESVRNLGTPVFGRRYFDLLRAEFGEQCEVATVVHEGRAVVSLMTFWFRDEVLPYYGGGLEAARGLSAYDLVYYDLMRRAGARGVRIYDFGRSKQDTGPFRYKKHWGFEPQPLSYEYALVRAPSMPNLSPTNPKYDRMVRLWKKLPLPITRLVGPQLSKYLG
jgi:FemAB-related protein (PEP-CTERM system-associated)